MKIKRNKNRIIVSFQSNDPYFEMGNFLIAQAGLANPFQVKMEKESNVNVKQISLEIKNLIPLDEILPEMSKNQITDLLYLMVFMTRQIEESGFLSRTCIWCKYEDIFYDTKNNKPVMLILPVSKAIEVEIGIDWKTSYLNVIKKIVSFFDERLAKNLYTQIKYYILNDKKFEETLEMINLSGNGRSEQLVPHMEKPKDRWLQLYHSGREGVLQFDIKQEEYVIGKKEAAVDGAIVGSEAVSRIHCKIVKQGRQFFLQDLDSVNHTFVNDELIPAYALIELNDKDVVSIADVDFRVHIVEQDMCNES